jgi:hypothetical protein
MMNTQWTVQRAVVNVEGDINQAALIWKLLGGSDERAFISKITEVYETSFVAPPPLPILMHVMTMKGR